MKPLQSTGQVARLLNTVEPKLSELVRTGKITPPPILAGRRLWDDHAVRQAAEALGLEPAARTRKEVDHAS